MKREILEPKASRVSRVLREIRVILVRKVLRVFKAKQARLVLKAHRARLAPKGHREKRAILVSGVHRENKVFRAPRETLVNPVLKVLQVLMAYP